MHFILDLLNGNLHIYNFFSNTDTENVFTVLIAYRYYSFEANDFSNVIVGLYSASVFSTQTPFGTMYHVNGACQKPAAIILLRKYYVFVSFFFFNLVAKRQLVENSKLPYKT